MKALLRALAFLAPAVCAYGMTTPTLYFTDLTSGPVGSIVTVYGANLSGSVTVNGVTATEISSSSSKISFQVPNTTSGNIVVSGSNTLPFTVRAGNIWYVATNGSDSNSGSQSSPWATIPHAFNTAACGDVIYAMNGVTQTALDNYDASLAVMRQCTEAAPLALVGYPGATVTIGSVNGQEYGIRNPNLSTNNFNGMVFANLVVRGANNGINDTGNTYWRIVGSDFSCPNGSGEAACVQLDQASYVEFLGNSIHNSGAGGTKYYHSFYGTTNTNNVEVGWNNIYDNNSCRGVQFYSTSGSPQYNLIVHDNIIDGQECDGINFSTVDATEGPIEAYNNVIYHVGLGGTTDGTPNYACIASLGYGTAGGQMLIYGNTMADCGSAGGDTAGAITVLSGSPTAVLESNLVMQNASEVIYSPNSDMSLVAATDNVLLNNGTAGVVNSNYQLVAGSPAIGAGTSYSGMLYDLAGVRRPQTGSEDAGAYLYSTSSTTSSPTATLSSTAVSFGSESVDEKSAYQNVTLSNSGSAALTISNIAIGGANASQFSSTNNCGSSVAAGQNCIIQAQFDPTAAGSAAATIAVNTNASNPAQSIALSGTGTAAATSALTLSPASIAFASQNVSVTSAAQSVTLKNTGTAALSISGITLTGTNSAAFKMTNGCASSLAAGASCTVQVEFAPTAAGTSSATLSVADNATGSPQTVALSGTAAAPATSSTTVHYSVNNLYFYNLPVGSTSTPSTITVTNTGSASFTISSIAMTGSQTTSFAATSNCMSIAPKATCTISVTTTPKVSGENSTTMVVTSNAGTTSFPLEGHGY